ncbi:class I SAM-dependent methyltransferase [Klebsiella pneumoniae]
MTASSPLACLSTWGRKNYATYFEVADRNLKPNGRFLLHTIGSKVTDHNVDPWIDKYIFPNGCLPSVRHIAEASEKHFCDGRLAQLRRRL